MQYHNMRNAYHNQEKRVFPGAGPFGIPAIPATDFRMESSRLVRFDYALRDAHPEDAVVHFFTDDYIFERVWREPERYPPILAKFRAVIAPDFSLYSDYPRATQIFNHFRRHWLGAYWASMGLTVVPCIRWVEGDPASFDWCLDGEPAGSTVCISTHGAIKGDWRKTDYLKSWKLAEARLKPSRVIIVGDTLPGLEPGCPADRAALDSMAQKRKYCRKVAR